MAAEETHPTPETETAPQTPGARIAAQKAAKAARKAANRGRDADLMEEKALEQARLATEWFSGHSRSIAVGLLVVALGIGGAVAWSSEQAAASHATGDKLWSAIETANATLRAEGASTADYEGPSFSSREERSKRATEKFQAMAGAAGSATASAIAAVGLGNAALDTGDFVGARAHFEKAASVSAADASIRLRALEGVAFTYEGEKAWDKADAAYAQVAALDVPRAKDLSDAHRARLLVVKGEREKALGSLKKLADALEAQSKKAPEERGVALSYSAEQLEARLAELDPSTVRGRVRPTGGISQEELRRIIEQLQAQQGVR